MILATGESDMAKTQLAAWRVLLPNFATMMGVNLAYEALHKLRVLGQNVTEIWINSLGIAALFAVAMWITSLDRTEQE